ncbi:LysE family translocator [Tropicimonas isoalkanivorans]|uniref:Threonine/homoserine/homoserine lactone efflux protein n=1 Tax=Tropicimonas isoalkanivorans TaxID=441112 RepID=A0A1I1Q7U4_9RHOB|nr:LysE family translocator [Tropicimonas isoalkanivorans]SFD15303.1 Threonine/homoserine/homoserine lactone efflux protein [Tropicimonas isoalkanivorans]
MIDPQTYYLFLLTSLVLVLSPGPDTVLILSRTIATGTVAGMMTLFGTQAGNVIHAILAGLGVSTLVLLFPLAFDVLKYAGAAYLVYLAVMAWRVPASLDLDTRLRSKGGGAMRYFYQGLVNNLVNPKMIPFFIALFPQFVHPEHGAVALQSFVLGATLAGMAIVWLGTVVVIVGRFRAVVTGSTTFLKLANRLAAVTFFGLACRLAVQER